MSVGTRVAVGTTVGTSVGIDVAVGSTSELGGTSVGVVSCVFMTDILNVNKSNKIKVIRTNR